MKASPRRSADAQSALPAFRLRHRNDAHKTSVRAPLPTLPPPVGEPRRETDSDRATAAKACRDRHPLARLMLLRAEAAAEIERLLTFLDDTDGLPDLEGHDEHDEETNDDEPSLGSRSSNGGDQSRWGTNDTWQLIDTEDEHDGAEPDDECDGKPNDEPSLGWPDGRVGQFQCGGFDDREVAVEPRVKEADPR